MSNGLSNSSDRWASIRERRRGDGNTSYNVQYYLDGKQRSLTLRDKLVADAFVSSVKAHGSRSALQMYGYEVRLETTQAAGITVADWVRRHIDNLTGVEQYTLDVYERYLRQDLGALGSIPLSGLTEEHIAAWVKDLETTIRPRTKRVLSPKSIKNLHGFLSGALGAAVTKGLMPANPAAGRRLPRTTGSVEKIDGDEMRMLSRDEFTKLHDAMIEHYRPLLRFLVASGCRWGEAAALKPGDIDKQAGTVKIRRAWKYSSAGYKIGPPKTTRSRRAINIPADVLDALVYDGQEYVFVNTHGGPVRYQAFRPVWDRAVAIAKLDPRPTPHDLRHTCASWLLAEGVPLLTVSRHLGHKSVKMTADVYADVDRTSHAAAADAMAKILAP
jgi:integrase